jgi:hypothetical protein
MRAYLIRCPDGAGLIAADEAIGCAIAGETGARFPR